MTALHGCPCLALTLLLVLGVRRCIAYCCRIDEQFGALQSHQSRCLGVPLVPAYEHAELAHAGLNRAEAEVARCEVELLVVGRVVGDVHLAILAGDRAVAFHDDSRVVIQTRSTALEERCDDNHVALVCQCAVRSR